MMNRSKQNEMRWNSLLEGAFFIFSLLTNIICALLLSKALE